MSTTDCFAALEALYTNPDGAAKKKANEWLINFQKSPGVWQVSTDILQRRGLELQAYYFAATSLRYKLLTAINEVSDQMKLREVVMQLLSTFAAGPVLIRRKLASCAAITIIHLIPQWKDALDSLTSAWGQDSHQNFLALLEVLGAVPEECNSRELLITRDGRARGRGAIDDFVPKLLQFLAHFLARSASSMERQEALLTCFGSWVRNGSAAEKSEVLAQCKAVIEFPLAHIRANSTLAPTSLLILGDLVKEVAMTHRQSPIASYLLGSIIGLTPNYEALSKSGDLEGAKGLAGLFTDMAEAFVSLVFQGSEWTPRILQLIVTITQHPHKDVVATTLHFWYMLRLRLVGRHREEENDDEEEGPDEGDEGAWQSGGANGGNCSPGKGGKERSIDQEKIRVLAPAFIEFLRAAFRLGRYPSDFETMDEEELDDFKYKYRLMASDALADCVWVLGHHGCLNIIRGEIEKEYTVFRTNPKNWFGLESALFLLRSLTRRVNPEDSFLTWVMALIAQGGLENCIPLRAEATLIIGRYSSWLETHGEQLPLLLQYVIGGLNNNKTATASAEGFCLLCRTCARQLTSANFFNNLLTVVSNCRLLKVQEQLDVVEGMTYIVAALPKEAVTNGLLGVLGPAVSQLHQLLGAAKQRGGGLVAKEEEEYCAVLDQIAHVYRVVYPPRTADPPATIAALVESMNRMWGFLTAVCQIYKNSVRIMERLCRVWKYWLKASGVGASVLLSPLLRTLQEAFIQRPLSCFLYCVSITVDTFIKNPTFQKEVWECVMAMSQRSLLVLDTTHAMTEQPDTVEDYFQLLCHLLRVSPQLLITHNSLPTIFECGLRGLTLQHKDALGAILDFFGLLLEEGRPDLKTPNPQFNHILSVILSRYGPVLMEGLAVGVSGAFPHSRVKFAIHPLQNIIAICGENAKPWLVNALSKVPNVVSPSKADFVSSVFHAYPMSLRHMVAAFGDACRVLPPDPTR